LRSTATSFGFTISNSQRSALPRRSLWRLRRATVVGRASRSFIAGWLGRTETHRVDGHRLARPRHRLGGRAAILRCPREGAERREGAGCGTPHPGAPPLPPQPTASDMRRKRGSTGTPERGAPRPSDVGARALAALHRGVFPAPARRQLSDGFPQPPECEVNWPPPAGAAPGSALVLVRGRPRQAGMAVSIPDAGIKHKKKSSGNQENHPIGWIALPAPESRTMHAVAEVDTPRSKRSGRHVCHRCQHDARCALTRRCRRHYTSDPRRKSVGSPSV
jgi:hypothetical protein